MKAIRKIDNPDVFWRRRMWLLEEYGEFNPDKYHKIMTRRGWEMNCVVEGKYYWTHKGIVKSTDEFKQYLLGEVYARNETV